MNDQGRPENSATEQEAPTHPSSEDNGQGVEGGSPENPQPAEDDEVSLGELRKFFARHQTQNSVLNVFMAETTVGTAGIGRPGQAPAETRQDDGEVGADEIDRHLRCYLEPKSFDRAMEVLRTRGLAVLVGYEGSGRAAGSLALAVKLRAEGAGVSRQSPTRTLAKLANKQYEAGQVHVIHDWVTVDEDAQASVTFHAQGLSEVLLKSNAYVILTAAAGRGGYDGLDGFTVAWEAPDPIALLDCCLALAPAGSLGDSDLGELRARALAIAKPRRVVQLADCAIAGGLEKALATVNDDDAERVHTWFKTSDRGSVRLAAALVFVGDLPRLTFERLHAQLAAVQAAFEPVVDDPDAKPPEDTSPFPQTRRALVDEEGIGQFLRRPPDVPGGAASYRPGFRTADLRANFLAELLDGYDYKLWEPLQAWLDDVTRQPPFDEEQDVIASAVALLARFSPEYAYAFLNGWAGGPLPMRLTATSALWEMADDDVAAPTALRWAVGWTRDRGQERALTAATALGGPLGQRYPLEASHWLWQLTRRGDRIRTVAQISLGNLLAVMAGTIGGPKPLLRFLVTRLRQLMEPDADPAARRTAFDTVVHLLGYGVADERSVIARVLSNHPDETGRVGKLWAVTISIRPHRHAAVESLIRTLTALDECDGGTDTAFHLGAAILPRLSGDALTAVEVALRNVSREPPLSDDVFSCFLDALTSPVSSAPASNVTTSDVTAAPRPGKRGGPYPPEKKDP